MLDFGTGIFWNDENGIDHCKRYPIQKNRSISSRCRIDDFNIHVTNKFEMISCNQQNEGRGVVYGEFGMDSTAVTEFQLLCEDQYKVKMI